LCDERIAIRLDETLYVDTGVVKALNNRRSVFSRTNDDQFTDDDAYDDFLNNRNATDPFGFPEVISYVHT